MVVESLDGGGIIFMVVDFFGIKRRRWGETLLCSWTLWMDGGDIFVVVDVFGIKRRRCVETLL